MSNAAGREMDLFSKLSKKIDNGSLDSNASHKCCTLKPDASHAVCSENICKVAPMLKVGGS